MKRSMKRMHFKLPRPNGALSRQTPPAVSRESSPMHTTALLLAARLSAEHKQRSSELGAAHLA
eukprot:6129620-Prymnesium_polylepis.1